MDLGGMSGESDRLIKAYMRHLQMKAIGRVRALVDGRWLTKKSAMAVSCKVSARVEFEPGDSTVTLAKRRASSLVNEFRDLCYGGDLQSAMKAMGAMEGQGIWADCVAYSELVKRCISHGAVDHGKRIHHHVFSNGHEPKTFLTNILLSMYVKFNMPHDAQALFEKMRERDVVSWTTMISACSGGDFHGKALQLLVLMVREGVRPNMFTFSSVLKSCGNSVNLVQLHGCIVKNGFERDPFVRSALIDTCSKLGEMKHALLIFNETETGDLVVWSSIIGGLAQNGDGDEALNLFKMMNRRRFHVQQSTLTSVLRACTGLALLELGRQVHVQVLKYLYDQDLILNNALLDMYCKCGSVEDASSVFNLMCDRDVISWSTMIAGLAQNGHSIEALSLFESMKSSGAKPNHITILGVLFACSHAGFVGDGWHHFRSMKRLFGIDPGREHYGCMVDLLGRAGKLDEAVALIKKMDCEPDSVTWRTLLGACRVHRNVDLAVLAAGQILRLDPLDTGTYISLSNIYATNQRWNDVAEIRRTMQQRGINKVPGCSWIEANKTVHAFVSDDNSHPQINKIVFQLNMLIRKLAGHGYVPDTNFILQDLEEEQREDSLRHHSEKLALAFALMTLSDSHAIRIRKNLRICGDCHLFFKLTAKMERRAIVVRDSIRYHHFRDGICSCGDYW